MRRCLVRAMYLSASAVGRVPTNGHYNKCSTFTFTFNGLDTIKLQLEAGFLLNARSQMQAGGDHVLFTMESNASNTDVIYSYRSHLGF